MSTPTDGAGLAPMKLGRVWLVEIVTARPGADALPPGFQSTWGGKAGVRITAYDRDRLGESCSAVELAGILLHPGPGPCQEFQPHDGSERPQVTALP